MKTALCVFKLEEEIGATLRSIERCVSIAAGRECDMVLFPETCLTGLDINGIPEQDYVKAHSIEDDEIVAIRSLAKVHDIYVGFGFIERDESSIYDSYLLVDKGGNDVLHYRRQSSGWYNPVFPANVYRCGNEEVFVDTSFGRIGILICGDLFDDGLIERVNAVKPGLFLYPFARAIKDHEGLQDQWDVEELPFYLERWQRLNSPVLAVNLLSDVDQGGSRYCGGAWAVDKDGKVVAQKPLLTDGLLVAEIDVAVKP